MSPIRRFSRRENARLSYIVERPLSVALTGWFGTVAAMRLTMEDSVAISCYVILLSNYLTLA